MKISKMLPASFVQFLLRIYFNRKKVSIGKNSVISRTNIFEGYNTILNNTVFVRSYLGFGSYIANNSNIKYCKIGKFCSIGDNVRVYLGMHPSSNWVSTHPSFFSTKKQAGFRFTDKQLFNEHKYVDVLENYVAEIGNDVWIGNNVTIMDGITIGDGSIIATGSIVTRDVLPYSIVAGVPAKIIRFRFSDEEIKFLIDFKWWNKEIEWIKKNHMYFKDLSVFKSNLKID